MNNPYRDKLNKHLAVLETLQKTITKKEERLNDLVVLTDNQTKAREIITTAMIATQQKFKTEVESLVTMAIKSVFSNRDFSFHLIFETKRNKMECRPIIMEGENEFTPKDDMGGGIVDIISFAMRIVLWSLQNPQSRNFIALDEPFRFVGKALIDKAGEMIKAISKELNIQFLINTHETELADIADKSFFVKYVNDQSEVSEHE